MDIIKAVIPAAGLGLRFLPLTKAVPKEMLPLGNKPAIQYIVEEALSSDIANFYVITSKNKHAILDHFDLMPELELFLKERNKLEILAPLDRLLRNACFSYIRQAEPLGLGHAIWIARHAIGKEYFSVLLPDDIIVGKTPALAQLMRIARQEKASVIAVQEVPRELVSLYGVIGIKKQITPQLYQVSHLLEKPDPREAPSNLAVVGRYVLSHKIFSSLETIGSYSSGELQLTDAISHMVQNNEKLFAYKVQGLRYDIGTPVGWVKAVIGCALQDPEYGPHIKKFISSLETPDSFLYNPVKALEHCL